MYRLSHLAYPEEKHWGYSIQKWGSCATVRCGTADARLLTSPNKCHPANSHAKSLLLCGYFRRPTRYKFPPRNRSNFEYEYAEYRGSLRYIQCSILNYQGATLSPSPCL